MKQKLTSKSAFLNRRVLISLLFFTIGVLLALLAFAVYPGGTALAQGQQEGQARPLTPEEIQRLAEGIKPLVNQSTEGLVQVHHADGSVSMDLQGRFQNVTVAKKEANGTISQSCVNNIDSAAAFFGINPRSFDPAKSASAPQSQSAPKQSDDH